MATLQKNSEKGNRIFWRLCFPDGTSKPKYKNSKSNVILHDLMPDIMKIETLSRRSEITPEDLIRALNLKIITFATASGSWRSGLIRGGPPVAWLLWPKKFGVALSCRTA